MLTSDVPTSPSSATRDHAGGRPLRPQSPPLSPTAAVRGPIPKRSSPLTIPAPPSGAGASASATASVSFQEPPASAQHQHQHQLQQAREGAASFASEAGSSLASLVVHGAMMRGAGSPHSYSHRRRGTTLSSRAASTWAEESSEDEEDDMSLDEQEEEGGSTPPCRSRGSSGQSQLSMASSNLLISPPASPAGRTSLASPRAISVRPPPVLRHSQSCLPSSSSSSSSSSSGGGGGGGDGGSSSGERSTLPSPRPLARSVSQGSAGRPQRPGSPLVSPQSSALPSPSNHQHLHHHLRAGGGGSGILSSTLLKSAPAVGSRITNEHKTYQLGAEIGRGGFGAVFTALNMNSGDLVAVKRLELTDVDPGDLVGVEQEMELLKKLRHPNIVTYVDAIRTDRHLHILLEYMENGSLAGVCKKFGRLPEPLTAIYITQVLHGLQYLHEQGVLHRDIKGANILTTKDGQVKLADFGVALKLKGTDTSGSSSSLDAAAAEQGPKGKEKAAEPEVDVVGSPYWMAPEIIEMSAPTSACDIWSLGCTVVELISGRPPYFELAPMAALFRIVQDEYPPLPEGISESLRDFLLCCFQKEPLLRPSAAQLLSHPWLLQQRAQLERARQQRSQHQQQQGQHQQPAAGAGATASGDASNAPTSSGQAPPPEPSSSTAALSASKEEEFVANTLRYIAGRGPPPSLSRESSGEGPSTPPSPVNGERSGGKGPVPAHAVAARSSAAAQHKLERSNSFIQREREWEEEETRAKDAIRRHGAWRSLLLRGFSRQESSAPSTPSPSLPATPVPAPDRSDQHHQHRPPSPLPSLSHHGRSGSIKARFFGGQKTHKRGHGSSIGGLFRFPSFSSGSTKDAQDGAASLDTDGRSSNPFQQRQQRRIANLLEREEEQERGTNQPYRERGQSSGSLCSSSGSSRSLQEQDLQKEGREEAGPLQGFVFESEADRAAHLARVVEIVRLMEQCRPETKERIAKEHLARVLELLDKSAKLAGVLIAQHGVGPVLSLLLEAKPQQNGGVAVAYVLAILHRVLLKATSSDPPAPPVLAQVPLQMCLLGAIPALIKLANIPGGPSDATIPANNPSPGAHHHHHSSSLGAAPAPTAPPSLTQTHSHSQSGYYSSTPTSLSFLSASIFGGAGSIAMGITGGVHRRDHTPSQLPFSPAADPGMANPKPAVGSIRIEATRCLHLLCMSEPGGANRAFGLQAFLGCGGLALVVDLLALYGAAHLSPASVLPAFPSIASMASSHAHSAPFPEKEARTLALLALDLLARAFSLTSSPSGGGPLLRRDDLCRALARQGCLLPLTNVFSRLLDSLLPALEAAAIDAEADDRSAAGGAAVFEQEVWGHLERVAAVVLAFARAEDPVARAALAADASVLAPLVKVLRPPITPCPLLLIDRLPEYARMALTVLKVVKQLSFREQALDRLDAAGAIPALVPLLGGAGRPQRAHGDEMEALALAALYNLCRVNAKRQAQATAADILPSLQRCSHQGSPVLKEVANTMLCDLAHHPAPHIKDELWRQDAVGFYLELLPQTYWQVPALNALAVWLAHEQQNLPPSLASAASASSSKTAAGQAAAVGRVEARLLHPDGQAALVTMLESAGGKSFEQLLGPLLEMLGRAPALRTTLAHSPPFVTVLLSQLQSPRAIVRKPLLTLLRILLQHHEDKAGFARTYNLTPVLRRLASSDPSQVLVRDLATQLLRDCQS